MILPYLYTIAQTINWLLGKLVRKHSTSFNPETGMFECDDGRGNVFTSKRLLDGLDNDKKWKKIK